MRHEGRKDGSAVRSFARRVGQAAFGPEQSWSARLAYLGLFTVSWDLVGNVQVGGFNVKVSIVAFALSALLGGRSIPRILSTYSRVFIVTGVILGLLIVASTAALDPRVGLLESATVIGTAVIPLLAVLNASGGEGGFSRALASYVWGALFTCTFGAYQLIAFYSGIPQFVDYQGVSGGVGRISSFSYEPAMFGYFLICALAAAIVRVRVLHKPWGIIQVSVIFSTLLLLNSRAVFLTLPLLVLLVWYALRIRPSRTVILGGASALVVAIGSVLLLAPRLFSIFSRQFLSIFDPSMPSSNAPRLQVLNEARGLALSHPWLGLGPSNFGLYIGDGHDRHSSLNKTVVNNVWLQAAIDAGFGLVLVEALLLVLVAIAFFRSTSAIAKVLAGGWLTVLIVGGMVVSNFYDATLWSLLALVLIAVRKGASYGAKEADGEQGTELIRFAAGDSVV